jgi:hypothetical protein
MYQNISLEVKRSAKEDLLALQFLGCIPYPLDKTFSLRFVDPQQVDYSIYLLVILNIFKSQN